MSSEIIRIPSVIRPTYCMHVAHPESNPLRYPLKSEPEIEPVHLLKPDGRYTRCGQHRSKVEKAWPFSVWPKRLKCLLGTVRCVGGARKEFKTKSCE